jgi:hypothetical protein
MNPLANSDLQTYVRQLVDRHLPDKGGEDNDPTAVSKVRPKSSGAKAPSAKDEKDQRKAQA